MADLDRRVFLQRAGIAGAAAGAAWLAPSITGASTAFAGTSCISGTGAINWADYTTNSTPPTSFTKGPSGNQVTITRSITAVNTPNPTSENNTVRSAAYGSGSTHKFYKMMMSNGSNWSGVGYDATFTFNKPLYTVAFSLFDMDSTLGTYDPSDYNFVDVVWLTATGSNQTFSATYSPSRTFSGDGTSTTHWQGTSLATDAGVTGNADVTFDGPITGFTIHYRSGNADSTSPYEDTTQQSIGLGDITFCL